MEGLFTRENVDSPPYGRVTTVNFPLHTLYSVFCATSYIYLKKTSLTEYLSMFSCQYQNTSM